MEPKISDGLEGVFVAATALSAVDGQGGNLTIAGYTVENASQTLSFERISADLWSAALEKNITEAEVKQLLQEERVFASSLIEKFPSAYQKDDGMDALRTSLSYIELTGLDDLRSCARLVASTAVFAAKWWACKNKFSSSIKPAAVSHAADYLRLSTDKTDISDALSAGLNSYLVAVSDHGMNASTFTARVIASTGSDLVSACVGAIGALKGPLHGGAPGPVLDMLQAIGEPAQAEAWIEGELKDGRRIMGMGHRIYRVRDPRAKALEFAIEKIEKSGFTTQALALARAVETAALHVLKKKYPTRALEANVEFYTAVLLDIVGLDRKQFSPTFAVGRISGWCAHFFEQKRTGRLIRPDSHYIGKKAQ